jgi:hypothetical protein
MNSNHIWLHFELPDTLTCALDIARNTIEDISRTIDVNMFGRIGMRLQYLYSMDGVEDFIGISEQKLFSIEVLNVPRDQGGAEDSGFEFMVKLRNGDSSINLRIQPVRRASESNIADRLPEVALMIDPDIYREGEISIADFRRFLGQSGEWASRAMPDVLTSILPER